MTVAEELANRNGCRYRLRDVLVLIDGRGTPQRVMAADWGADETLIVSVIIDEEKYKESWEYKSEQAAMNGEIVLCKLSDLPPGPSLGTKDYPAERCHLDSRWPVACCKPKRRNEWNSKGRRWFYGPK